MQFVPLARKTGRGWRALILLFAALLTLGFLQPLTASAAAPALLRAKDATVVEADSGSTKANVKIVLSKRVNRRVSLAYTTRDGTAEAGSDYLEASGRLTFPKRTRVAFVHVRVVGDTVEESDEFFKVRIFDAVNAKIADPVGKVTVVDDDEPSPPPEPKLYVDDLDVDEGDAAYFKVRLSASAPEDITFDYTTSNGSATAGSDYDAASYNNYKIPKGSSSATIKVTTREDSTDEPDETFYLKVSDLHGASAGDLSGKATIKDDDPAAKPKLYVDDTTVDEGEQASFKVHLSYKAPSDVYFDFNTEDGTAVAGKDYDTTTGNNVKIVKGEDSTTVKVWTREDDGDESDETFKLKISDVTGATEGDYSATATIKDDDTPAKPRLFVDDVTVDEGGTAYVKVRLSFDAPGDVYFDFDTADDTAEAGKDYDAKSVDDVKIAKGDDAVILEVKIRQDDFEEENETFKLKISDVTGATEGDYTAVATIKDDD
jgi:hypothetical protein